MNGDGPAVISKARPEFGRVPVHLDDAEAAAILEQTAVERCARASDQLVSDIIVPPDRVAPLIVEEDPASRLQTATSTVFQNESKREGGTCDSQFAKNTTSYWRSALHEKMSAWRNRTRGSSPILCWA